jgi:hypothetical protein
VGPLAYIHERTGTLLSRRPLAREIAAALQQSAAQTPRAFAEARLSCHESLKKLNTLLKTHDAAAGRPWTQDLAAVCWRPHPKLLDEADRIRLAPSYASLHALFPDVFPADLMQTSWR